jgi:c(7)-type cytochrome triheme protein
MLLLGSTALAQIYLPKPAPEPSEYGKVVLDKHSATGPGPVVFDHWLHRSHFTCRLCHVDVGFAMEANATGITAATNREGFHCGACHDGKKLFEGRPIFPACSDAPENNQCDRCHSLGKPGARKYEYHKFTAKFPKGIYGVDWERAEQTGVIKPADFVEGLSVKRAPMPRRGDFSIEPHYSWVHPILFSHQKHVVWNGCELCHPDIFPAAKKGTVRYSMFLNIEGRYCGACHGKVAFPLNNCQGCHPRGPMWVQ